MKHIVRIDKKRLPKKTSFTVRKQPVNRFKIERFKKGHPALPEPPSSRSAILSIYYSLRTCVGRDSLGDQL